MKGVLMCVVYSWVCIWWENQCSMSVCTTFLFTRNGCNCVEVFQS